MADIQDSNITPLRPKSDRTAAERQAERRQKAAKRQRLSRERRKQRTPLVTPDQSVTRHIPPVTARDTPVVMDKTPSKRDAVSVSTLTAALALTTVSGGFSIFGMAAVFTGALYPVIAMGVALELGKLSAVAWLGRHGQTAGWPLRGCLIGLVAVLMGLNAVGAYGFLAKAHIGHALAGDLAVAGRAAEIESRMSVQTGVVTDLDRRIAQIDSAVSAATQRGRVNTALTAMEGQRQARRSLTDERNRAAATS